MFLSWNVSHKLHEPGFVMESALNRFPGLERVGFEDRTRKVAAVGEERFLICELALHGVPLFPIQ